VSILNDQRHLLTTLPPLPSSVQHNLDLEFDCLGLTAVGQQRPSPNVARRTFGRREVERHICKPCRTLSTLGLLPQCLVVGYVEVARTAHQS
jgi:hypothetical protein